MEWAVRQIENQINEMLKFGHEIKSGYDVIEIWYIYNWNLNTKYLKDREPIYQDPSSFLWIQICDLQLE